MTIQDQQDQAVLRLRLATLKRNLRQVEATPASVAQRRDEVDRLAQVFDKKLDGIQLAGEYLMADIEGCLRLVQELTTTEGVPALTAKRLDTLVNQCAGYAKKIQTKATNGADTVQTMARRWKTLTADEKFDDHIRQIFALRASDLIGKIDALAAVAPAEAWTTFQDDIRAQSEDLFAEYVEFLGGLALRDTGLCIPGASTPDDPVDPFGADVYVMADDLIRQIYRIGGDELWHSLTIPARRDAAACTRARMIRLTFPEWTVWAVPLAAHEFGRVVIDKNEKEIADAQVSRYVGPSRGLKTLQADIFGTYAMGPSYAFATVYVRLDPRTGNENKNLTRLADGPVRSDSERAYVVLRTLQKMDREEVLDKATKRLQSQWEFAIEQAKGVPLPTGRLAEKLDTCVDLFFGFLEAKAPAVRYSAERWAKVQQFEEFRTLVETKWTPLPGQEDVRDILNAAWLQRLTPAPSEGAPEDIGLADDTLTLWRRDHATRQRTRQRGTGN